MPPVLEKLIRRTSPDTTPEPVGYTNPNVPPEQHPGCICRALLDAAGQNPTCPIHGWWTRDPIVLKLADLTRELGTAWEAAMAIDWNAK